MFILYGIVYIVTSALWFALVMAMAVAGLHVATFLIMVVWGVPRFLCDELNIFIRSRRAKNQKTGRRPRHVAGTSPGADPEKRFGH